MAISTSILTQFAYLDIFQDIGRDAQDIKAWVANQNYFLNNYVDGSNFSLNVHNTHSLKIAYANDCNRMSVAAFESVIDINQNNTLRKSGAWGVIRAYYSAFFAAHAIMRMYGVSCSQIEVEHAKKINEVFSLTSSHKVDKGFYCISSTKDFSTVKFKKYKDSHAGTWECFNNLMVSLKNNVHIATALSTEKIKTLEMIDSIKYGLTNNGNVTKGNWLSQVRNVVNYQHKYGVWFPYERGGGANELVERISQDWKVLPDMVCLKNATDGLELFFKTACLILSLCKDLLSICISKNSNRSPIFICGVWNLLNQANVEMGMINN
ncbi:hypothetical protein RBA69_04925 [Brenneria goodwinii]|uniref:hypothetical protein n=1 Tax=Brenneria goodwinii TaxID=1109412 RepID=UPI0036ECDB38